MDDSSEALASEVLEAVESFLLRPPPEAEVAEAAAAVLVASGLFLLSMFCSK